MLGAPYEDHDLSCTFSEVGSEVIAGDVDDEVAVVVFTRCPCCGRPAPQRGDRYVVVSFPVEPFADELKFVLLLACATKMAGRRAGSRARRARVSEAVAAVGETLQAIVSEMDGGRVRADIQPAQTPGLQ